MTRFRITTYPAEPLPHPGDGRRVPYKLADGMIVVDWPVSLSHELLPPSPRWSEEMYLDLITVDLSDTKAIMDFVDVFGTLGMREGRAVNPRTGLAGLGLYTASEQMSEELWAGHSAEERAGDHPIRGETIDEFRWGALCVRDLVSAWRAVKGELDHTAHDWEAPIWEAPTEPDYFEVETMPWDEDGPTSLLEVGLADALETFAPAIIVNQDAPVFDDRWGYEICCLELFNHIVEEAAYKRCSNETCGKFFVRQRGRALHGQHRTTGVKYCSAECAKMQASRAYRRRKAKLE